MRFTRILVPTDFSTCAAHAARVAAELAATVGATIRLVHVLTPPAVLLPDGSAMLATPAQLVELTARADDELAQARSTLLAGRLAERPVEVATSSLMGDPADEILRLAASGDYDVLVMGTHGRTGLRRLVLGSVAEKVLRHAPLPVLTVREPGTSDERAADAAG